MVGSILRLVLLMAAVVALSGCVSGDPYSTARDRASVPGAAESETRMTPNGGLSW